MQQQRQSRVPKYWEEPLGDRGFDENANTEFTALPRPPGWSGWRGGDSQPPI